jgi:hypothetical protein
MTSPDDIPAAEATALERASKILAQMGDALAEMRRHIDVARVHAAAIERGEADPPLISPAPTETLQ